MQTSLVFSERSEFIRQERDCRNTDARTPPSRDEIPFIFRTTDGQLLRQRTIGVIMI